MPSAEGLGPIAASALQPFGPPQLAAEVGPKLPPAETVGPETQQAGPLFGIEETDISAEEEEAARVVFNRIATEVRAGTKAGMSGDVVKEIFRQAARATAAIRRRDLQ